MSSNYKKSLLSGYIGPGYERGLDCEAQRAKEQGSNNSHRDGTKFGEYVLGKKGREVHNKQLGSMPLFSWHRKEVTRSLISRGKKFEYPMGEK